MQNIHATVCLQESSNSHPLELRHKVKCKCWIRLEWLKTNRWAGNSVFHINFHTTVAYISQSKSSTHAAQSCENILQKDTELGISLISCTSRSVSLSILQEREKFLGKRINNNSSSSCSNKTNLNDVHFHYHFPSESIIILQQVIGLPMTFLAIYTSSSM